MDHLEGQFTQIILALQTMSQQDLATSSTVSSQLIPGPSLPTSNVPPFSQAASGHAFAVDVPLQL
jgi:hypothetical protein